jgi:NAD(P)-dependent dehydrogenase (short-subunit alcohol dehydrogenase family)
MSEGAAMRLHQRVAIVTGGGSGIGAAIARLFAQEGAAVVVADLLVERAERVAVQIRDAGGHATAIYVDVSSQADVVAMTTAVLAERGRIDVLVNNAGIARGGDALKTDEATWDLNFAVVLKGAFLCTKAALPSMLAQERGSIVNISSVNGLTGLGEAAYSAAKAGLINFTQNLAIRYGSKNVRANVICPGTVRTPIWSERVQSHPDVFDRLSEWYPLGRVGEPEDIAKAVLFLASDDAAWITGAVLAVDGGLTAGSYRMARDLGGEEA